MDSPCFIDMAKSAIGKSPDASADDVWHLKKLLEAAKAGDLAVFTSSLSVAECSHAEGVADAEVQRLFKGLLTSGQYVYLVQDSVLVAERARDLRWVHKLTLRGADSVHVASALEMKCIEFVTTDEKIHKQKSVLRPLGLAVIYAHETTLLPDEYRQGKLI
jgi:predicted nucleic acid-binding protein